MDIAFYLYASIGVIIFGIAKGGFAGPASILAVPIMALAMNPAVAAGILLPVLLIMDFIAIYFYWKKWDINLAKIILPPAIIGIIIGGRLGYVLIYNPSYYFENLIEIPMIWNGGMSFHGAVVGVIFTTLIFCKKNNQSVFYSYYVSMYR